jgi:3-dehydrosphinganine reductase
MGSPGFIVNISSFAGLLGLYGYSSYSASKFGIVGLSESLYLELRGRGIRVGIVYPTDTDTPQLRNELKRRPDELSRMTGLGGTIRADKVARSVVRGIRKGSFHIFPTFMPWFIHKVHGPFGPVVRLYLRRKLIGR